jgi:hypothetical protein
MRRPLTTLSSLSIIGLLALVGVAALGAKLVRGSGELSTRAGTRTWPVTLSPAPSDLALAQVSFHGRVPTGAVHSWLRVSVGGAFGGDYMAASVPRLVSERSARVLIVLVNRPTPLLDPVSVHLHVQARGSLGVPRIETLENVFSRSATASRPALCDLPLHGIALAAGKLSVVGTLGQAPTGFAGASTVAQAYDLACGLPHASTFEQAVRAPAEAQPPQPVPPAPEPPKPPVGKLPGEGCVPTPGYACPG